MAPAGLAIGSFRHPSPRSALPLLSHSQVYKFYKNDELDELWGWTIAVKRRDSPDIIWYPYKNSLGAGEDLSELDGMDGFNATDFIMLAEAEPEFTLNWSAFPMW
jgi:hypothetical protein